MINKLKSRNFLYFFILCISYFGILFLFKKVLNIDQLIYNSLSEKITAKEITKIFEYQDKTKWINYVLFSLILFIKISLMSSVLYIGTFFLSKIPVTFKQLWAIVLSAEFVFLFVPVFKIVWFYFFQTNYKLEDIQYFYPLSALNIVGYKDLEPWFVYPFQTLNLFELAYWLILAYYICKATETNMDNGLKIVATSYGSALLLWVVTIMFFTLNYS